MIWVSAIQWRANSWFLGESYAIASLTTGISFNHVADDCEPLFNTRRPLIVLTARCGPGNHVVEHVCLCRRRVGFPVVGETHDCLRVPRGRADSPNRRQKSSKRRVEKVMRPDQSAVHVELKCPVQLGRTP